MFQSKYLLAILARIADPAVVPPTRMIMPMPTPANTPAKIVLMITSSAGTVFAGVGIGMIIRVGGTTAGSAILARIANKYFDWNISYALLMIDLVVVFSSYFIIGAEKLMFTIVMTCSVNDHVFVQSADDLSLITTR